MANKGSLFDQVAKAMSNASHARESLRNLDERAYRMQGNAKVWGKNADKFNANANALNSKAAWNDYVAAKLKYDATKRVNDANALADKNFREGVNRFSAWNDLAENADFGNISERDGYRSSNHPLSDGEKLAKLRVLDAEGSDSDLLGMDYYDIENLAPQIQDLQDPRGYMKQPIPGHERAEDIFDDTDWGRHEYGVARGLYNQIAENTPYHKWDLSDPESDWRAMERLQTVTTPRYRK